MVLISKEDLRLQKSYQWHNQTKKILQLRQEVKVDQNIADY